LHCRILSLENRNSGRYGHDRVSHFKRVKCCNARPDPGASVVAEIATVGQGRQHQRDRHSDIIYNELLLVRVPERVLR